MGAVSFTGTAITAGVDGGWPAQEQAAALYKKAMKFFREAIPEKFASVPPEVADDSWIRHMKAVDTRDEDYVLVMSPVDGPGRGIIRVRRSDGELLLAGADIHPGKGGGKQAPVWSLAEAVEKAAGWLNRFGWEVPAAFRVSEVNFVDDWFVHWRRYYGSVPELHRGEESGDQYSAILREGDTGVRLVRHIWGPEPSSLTPAVSQTDAILKAAKALPAAMATEVYKMWMPEGMSPIGCSKAELVVLRPNWLLDRKRYSLAGPKGPVERRLCWQVTFQLHRWDKSGEKNGRPVFKTGGAGEVALDVDAVTGEVVGGEMLPTSG